MIPSRSQDIDDNIHFEIGVGSRLHVSRLWDVCSSLLCDGCYKTIILRVTSSPLH